MASTGLQLLGLTLAVLGLVGGALACAAPLWRVSAFVGGELVVAQVTWEGLWMTCLSQSTGEIQCKAYDSTLALAPAAQAARGLTVLALALAALAVALGVAGAKGTRCCGGGRGEPAASAKARLARAAGGVLVLAGGVYAAPVCWTAYGVIRDFYDPAVAPALKRELGPALYLGWGAGLMMATAGALLNAGSAEAEPGPRGGGAGGGGRGFQEAAAAAAGGGVSAEGKQPEKAFV